MPTTDVLVLAERSELPYTGVDTAQLAGFALIVLGLGILGTFKAREIDQGRHQ